MHARAIGSEDAFDCPPLLDSAVALVVSSLFHSGVALALALVFALALALVLSPSCLLLCLLAHGRDLDEATEVSDAAHAASAEAYADADAFAQQQVAS